MGAAETVRVLVPDHMDLHGVLGQAIEFAGSLRHANDPAQRGEGDPWQLPGQLIAPELEAALDAILLHDPRFDHFAIGDHRREDAAIALACDRTGHMGVHIATATRTQLERLAAAAALVDQAEATAPEDRLPSLQEVAEFAAEWRRFEQDEDGDLDASLSAWRTATRILRLAIAGTPSERHRPARLYDPEARLTPVADTAGTSPAADTATLLAAIDASADRPVDLDADAFAAYRRLTVEWHIAIYGDRADSIDSLLASYTY
ncbi:hypothetical protein CU254_42635 (plasmid) [Amycolatopsis sp. AA4]|uniref:hypothetical protein n=1 Tax=Actinomycetes TaxID=1760 RepID=UPI0001B57BD1|nr:MULTISPECIES: hypothetical protein [Actinomycetes]ATY17283.1 hypothetical protein CU254_42635 [Amycolatopsis sp. AA4]EFL12736.1 predicted protein [Streptomyces sp. AA4]